MSAIIQLISNRNSVEVSNTGVEMNPEEGKTPTHLLLHFLRCFLRLDLFQYLLTDVRELFLRLC